MFRGSEKFIYKGDLFQTLFVIKLFLEEHFHNREKNTLPWENDNFCVI